MWQRLAGMLLLGGVVALFVWAAMQQSKHVNTDMNSTDQSAYLTYAKNMARTDFRFVGGRNRMPVYPALMSLFYKQGMPDEEFFELGKKIGIVIGLVGLVVIYLVFLQISKPVDALAATLVVMFTIFVYKSPYFQAEVLYYIISFVLFYLLLIFVKESNFIIAALAGVVGGIGYLTKASVLPAMFIAALFVLVRGFINFFRRDNPEDRRSLRLIWKSVFCVIVFMGCFLMVVSPYLLTSKDRFGCYFYNVNSTFYMWYDSWEEVKQGTRAHGDRKGWPDMPAEQLPSFGRYIRTHSPGEIVSRISKGLIVVGLKAFQYAELLLVYLGILLFLSVQNRTFLIEHLFRRRYPGVLLFVLGYFSGYILLYAWYFPISSGNRFVLSLFLPAVFMMVGFISYARKNQLSFNCLGRKFSASDVSPLVLVFLVLYVLAVLPCRISSFYGGS